MEPGVLISFAIALGLGLLVGLERERAAERVAGIRTFALITLLGAFAALLDRRVSVDENGVETVILHGWIVATTFLALAGLLVTSGLIRRQRGEEGPGITTEVAALLMFGVGAAVMAGHEAAAVVVGGAVAVLLHWKRPLHLFVSRMGESEFAAVVRLVIIALVILPVLPNRSFGPYGVLNPFQIWLMVVLIVSISLGAYLAYRLVGSGVGVFLAGILGGLISSTATTVSYGRQSRVHPAMSRSAAVVIMLASTIVFVRVLLEIRVVAAGSLGTMAPPIVAMMAFVGLVALVSYFLQRGEVDALPEHDVPSDLRAAIVFGLLYAAVLFGLAMAQEHFGDRASYTVAVLSGLTDMDAITLATGRMIEHEGLDPSKGWRMIVVGAMANMVFKAAAVAVLGHPRLFVRITIMFAIVIAGGFALLLFWPG